jgi:hypothetical protein
MIEIRNQAAQGDVLFRRVASIPKGAKRQKRKGPLVVAHSETGHHHSIHQPDVKLFTTADPFVCYLRLDTPFADVVHHRPHDTHETLRLVGDKKAPSFYEVRRQREHTPEGMRMVQD